MIGSLAGPAASDLFAQSFSVPVPDDAFLQSWRWRDWSPLEGRSLRDVAGDGERLFIALRDGVVEYDGSAFQETSVAELDGTAVETVHRGRNGTVHLGTGHGLYEWTGPGLWREIFPGAEAPHAAVRDIVDVDGVVYAATGWGLLRVDDRPTLLTSGAFVAGARTAFPDVEVVPVPDRLVPVSPWGSGLVVTAGSEPAIAGATSAMSLVAVREGGELDSLLEPGERLLRPDDFPLSWGADGIAAAVESGMTVEVEGPDGARRSVVLRGAERPGGFRDFRLWSLHVSDAGALWLGFEAGGAAEVPLDGPTALVAFDGWVLHDEVDGVSTALWPVVGEDGDGRVWLFSENGRGGANRFEGGRWLVTRLADLGGSDVSVSVTRSSDGAMWVGGLGALHRWSGGAWRVYESPVAPIPTARTEVSAAGSTLWIGGAGAGVRSVELSSTRWDNVPGVAFGGAVRTAGGLEEWFVDERGRLLRRSGGPGAPLELVDAPIDTPVGVRVVRSDVVVVVGGDDGVSATAILDGSGWRVDRHPDLSWSIDPRTVFEASDGALWMSGSVDENDGQRGGVIELRDGRWTHHTPPGPTVSSYGIGEDDRGRIWLGGPGGLRLYDGDGWVAPDIDLGPGEPRVDAVASGDGALWIGTRANGALRYRGDQWTHFDMDRGLPSNAIVDVLVRDTAVWILTPSGVAALAEEAFVPSPFDGTLPLSSRGRLAGSPDGAVWLTVYFSEPARAGLLLNRFRAPFGAHSLRLGPERDPPDTWLTPPPERVPPPGRVSLTWDAHDPWLVTPSDRLTYSHRLNDGPWSPFGAARGVAFDSLSAGLYRFELRARDLDGNVDPTPAVATWTVVPPVWRQLWFQLLVGGLLAIVALEALGLARRGRRLADANATLEARVASRTQELRDTYEDLVRETREREVAEKRLLQAQKMEALGRLAAGVAHDFNNLLTVIRGTVELLAADRPGDAPLARDLGQIDEAATRASELTKQLLAVSREQVLRPGRVDLVGVVRGMEEMFGRLLSEDVHLEIRADDDVRPVWADRSSLEQVLLNLVVNAWEAIPGSGRVRVDILEAEVDGDGVGGIDAELEPGPYVVLEVSDDGDGIEPAHLDRIFEPFFSTKTSGTGLGLATVHGIVEQSGGALTVRSERGVGTTFTAYLPAAVGVEPAPEVGEPAEEASGGRERILLIEDEDGVREVATRVLQGLGYDVLSTADAEAAFELVEAAGAVDLLVTDVVLPGVSGVEAARVLRERFPSLKVLFVSGYAAGYRGTEMLAGDVSVYLQKPFRNDELAREVRRLLDVPP